MLAIDIQYMAVLLVPNGKQSRHNLRVHLFSTVCLSVLFAVEDTKHEKDRAVSHPFFALCKCLDDEIHLDCLPIGAKHAQVWERRIMVTQLLRQDYVVTLAAWRVGMKPCNQIASRICCLPYPLLLFEFYRLAGK